MSDTQTSGWHGGAAEAKRSTLPAPFNRAAWPGAESEE